VRNETDFLYERKMADVNRSRGVETLLLPTEPALREVSSSEVRRRLDENEEKDTLLPPEVEAYLKTISNKP
jgi:phosphopantetheine adenylyltransferase